jgi:hypothetical protein
MTGAQKQVSEGRKLPAKSRLRARKKSVESRFAALWRSVRPTEICCQGENASDSIAERTFPAVQMA